MPGVSSTIVGRSPPRGDDAAQDLEQLRRVVVDGQHLVLLEQHREGARHHEPVLEHVGHSARRAGVVLEDDELAAAGIAHQVDAGDVHVDAARRLDADHLAAEVRAREHQRARDLAVAQDALRTVDVLQEEIQGDDALGEPALHPVPFGAREDAWHEIEGEEALGAAAVAVDGEGDALEQERQVGQPAAFVELGPAHGLRGARGSCDSARAVLPRLRTSRRRTPPGSYPFSNEDHSHLRWGSNRRAAMPGSHCPKNRRVASGRARLASAVVPKGQAASGGHRGTENVVDGRRVYFVSADPALLAQRETGARLASLLLPPGACPPPDG